MNLLICVGPDFFEDGLTFTGEKFFRVRQVEKIDLQKKKLK